MGSEESTLLPGWQSKSRIKGLWDSAGDAKELGISKAQKAPWTKGKADNPSLIFLYPHPTPFSHDSRLETDKWGSCDYKNQWKLIPLSVVEVGALFGLHVAESSRAKGSTVLPSVKMVCVDVQDVQGSQPQGGGKGTSQRRRVPVALIVSPRWRLLGVIGSFVQPSHVPSGETDLKIKEELDPERLGHLHKQVDGRTSLLGLLPLTPNTAL